MRAVKTAVTAAAWIAHAARRLRRAGLFFGHGTDNPEDEAAWILSHACGLPPSALSRVLRPPLTAASQARAEQLITERIGSRRPTAYLLGEAWLSGQRFFVDERVIIPRSFIAELLANQLQPWLQAEKVRKVLDLCTGSGCLAILAAKAFRKAAVDASDISRDALEVAGRNVRRHRLSRRIRLIRSDLFRGLAPTGGGYDLIICNPPYVNARAMRMLPAEYRHEPVLALAGGHDGLGLVHQLLRQVAQFLAPRGILVVEIGHNRKALEKAHPKLPFTWLETSGGDQFVFLLTRRQLTGMAAAGKRKAK